MLLESADDLSFDELFAAWAELRPRTATRSAKLVSDTDRAAAAARQREVFDEVVDRDRIAAVSFAKVAVILTLHRLLPLLTGHVKRPTLPAGYTTAIVNTWFSHDAWRSSGTLRNDWAAQVSDAIVAMVLPDPPPHDSYLAGEWAETVTAVLR